MCRTTQVETNHDDSDQDELEEFLRKNSQDSKRKTWFEFKNHKISNTKEHLPFNQTSSMHQCEPNNEDENEEDVIVVDGSCVEENSIDEKLFFNESWMYVDNNQQTFNKKVNALEY